MEKDKLIEPLYLTSHDIELLKKRKLELGRGTDGIVYKTGKFSERDSLYKIYYKTSPVINNPNYKKILDSEGVNIANNREVLNKEQKFSIFKTNYFDSNGLKVNGIETVYKAIERQKYIKRTKLQKRPIFIDGHFGGTVIHNHRHHIPIHLLKLYPLKTKIKVLKELLLSIKELIENYIYHIDLCLKPEGFYRGSNVLMSIGINPFPAIIDVDGKSAIYTEKANEFYYYKSLLSFRTLISEILFNINIEKLEELDFDFLERELQELGLTLEQIEIIFNQDLKLKIPELEEYLDDMLLLKKI